MPGRPKKGKREEKGEQQQQQQQPKQKVVVKDSPFEVHKVLRQRHKVDGRRLQAQQRSTGQRREQGNEIRRRTLLLDLKGQGKKNLFVDRRLGEKDDKISNEEKMLARWHRERASKKLGSSLFNLDDDDDGSIPLGLTHLGKSVDEVAVDDYVGDDDELADEREAEIDSAIVERAHFGGGADDEEEGRHKSAREIYDEVIARSKKRKAEKAVAREERAGLLGKLDSGWASISQIVLANRRSKEDDHLPVIRVSADGEEETVNPDAVNVGGLLQANLWPKELGATDAPVPPPEKKMKLASGAALPVANAPIPTSFPAVSPTQEEKDDDFDKLVRSFIFEAKAPATDKLKTPEQKAKEQREALEKLESERQKRMRGEGDMEEDGEGEEEEGDDKSKEERKLRKKALGDVDDPLAENEAPALPFTFSVPESYDQWTSLTSSWSAREREIASRRVVACNHPTLDPENGEKLIRFLEFLLQDLEDCCESLADAEVMAKAVHHVALEIEGDRACEAFSSYLKEKLFDSEGTSWPTSGVLLVAKLALEVFPASDFRHPIATPVILSLCSHLIKAKIASRSDLLNGIFACCVLRSAVSLSARFLPEVLVFLTSALRLFTDKEVQLHMVPNASVKRVAGQSAHLLPTFGCSSEDMDGAEFPYAVLRAVLLTACGFYKIWSGKTHPRRLFSGILSVAKSVKAEWLEDACCTTAHKQLLSLFKKHSGKDAEEADEDLPKFRTIERKNPAGLKEYTPKVVEQKVKRKASAAVENPTNEAERQEGMRRLKKAADRHRKAAVRELKKDGAFVAAEREREKQKEDEEIKEKGNRVMRMLQDEQHQAKVDKRQKESERRRLRL